MTLIFYGAPQINSTAGSQDPHLLLQELHQNTITKSAIALSEMQAVQHFDLVWTLCYTAEWISSRGTFFPLTVRDRYGNLVNKEMSMDSLGFWISCSQSSLLPICLFLKPSLILVLDFIKTEVLKKSAHKNYFQAFFFLFFFFLAEYTQVLKCLMYRPPINLLSSHDNKERSWEMTDRSHFRERGLSVWATFHLVFSYFARGWPFSLPCKSKANLE